jgi:hypothetical protein
MNRLNTTLIQPTVPYLKNIDLILNPDIMNNGTISGRAYVQFRGSEFHTRNVRSWQLQEQRRAKAHSRQVKSKQFNFNGSSSPLEGG